MASSVRLRRALLVSAAAASVLLLSACAPGKGAAENFTGLPASEEGGAGESAGELGEPQAVWLGDGGQIAVTLYGSSSCPPVGTGITVVAPKGEGNTISVEVPEPSDGACTADLVPHTTVFWTPMNITTTEDLTVEVQDQSLTVPVK